MGTAKRGVFRMYVICEGSSQCYSIGGNEIILRWKKGILIIFARGGTQELTFKLEIPDLEMMKNTLLGLDYEGLFSHCTSTNGYQADIRSGSWDGCPPPVPLHPQVKCPHCWYFWGRIWRPFLGSWQTL